jgi:hypothetical protein
VVPECLSMRVLVWREPWKSPGRAQQESGESLGSLGSLGRLGSPGGTDSTGSTGSPGSPDEMTDHSTEAN